MPQPMRLRPGSIPITRIPAPCLPFAGFYLCQALARNKNIGQWRDGFREFLHPASPVARILAIFLR